MTDYTPTGKPPEDTRGIAKQMRDEFALIQAAINSKGNSNLLVFGGTEAQGATVNDYVLTVTPAITSYTPASLILWQANHTSTGAATFKIGSLATLSLKSVAGGALAANDIISGQWYLSLYTGSEFRLAAVTKNYIDQLAFLTALPAQIVDGITRALRSLNGSAFWVIPSGDGAETRTTSTTLTAASAAVQILNMSGFGKALTLPDARTLTKGATRFVANNLRGKYPGGIIDGSGRVLGQVNDGELAEFHLDDNSTAAGVWSYTGNLDPWFIDSDTGFSISSAGTVSTTNIDATRGLLFYTKPTTGYPAVRLIKDNGNGVAPTVSNELILKSAATTVDSDNVVLVGTSNRLLVRLNDSSVVCVDISNPASITGGTDAALTFTGGTLYGIRALDNQYLAAVVADSTATLSRAKCIDCGASGTAVTVGAEANTASYAFAPTFYYTEKANSTTLGVFGQFSNGASKKAILHSLTRTSGTTLSWSANAGDPTGYRTDNTTQLTATFSLAADKIMLPFYANTDAGRYVVVTFAASATPTFGTVANSGVTASGRTFSVAGSPDRTKYIGYANGDASATSIEIATISGTTVTVGTAAPVTAGGINVTANMQAAIDNNGRGFVTWKSSIWGSGGNDKIRLFTTSGTTPTFGTEPTGAPAGQLNGLSTSFSVQDYQIYCGSGVFYKNAYINGVTALHQLFTVKADATENLLAEAPSFSSSLAFREIAGGVAGVYVATATNNAAFPPKQDFAVFSGGGYKMGTSKYWGVGLSFLNNLASPNSRPLRLSFQHPDTKGIRNATIRTYRFAEV
jgi:hypothetical protein